MPPPLEAFLDNAIQAVALLDLHEHHKHEVLTKSCVVLLVASWEAFIEDCAEAAVDFLINEVTSPHQLLKELLKHLCAELKGHKNEIKIWDLCGDGWRQIVKDHYKAMLAKHLGQLNTPRAANIDALYKVVLGLENLSSCWHWKGMPSRSVTEQLGQTILLRGAIAHRVQTSKKVTRALTIRIGRNFLCLGIKTSNRVRSHIYQVTGKYPWAEESLRSVK